MVRYRRNRIAGATYFFTVTLRDRRSDLLVREVDALRAAWRAAAKRVPHVVIAAVVLPDHLHAVIRMADATADYPRLWQDIKKGFTRRVVPAGGRSPWQPRYWERTVRDEAELQALVDYVHINPVKHGLVETVAAWPHSSVHRFMARGVLPNDRAGIGDVKTGTGEP
ncbi:transposase [Pseudoxanthomonas sp.]|uniref:REP-associated tyrosine transposase n=1 Tax=Pseudoxanthomonas sp. TaxID=1871049 RepID=UPI0025D20267|nr:transposase [Pseudoxanthomonas sp.]